MTAERLNTFAAKYYARHSCGFVLGNASVSMDEDTPKCQQDVEDKGRDYKLPRDDIEDHESMKKGGGLGRCEKRHKNR
jgi:hypothetical protein